MKELQRLKPIPLLILALSGVVLSSCRPESRDARAEKIYLFENGGKTIPLNPRRDFIRILEFPNTRQAENWTCGPNCVQTICAYYGEDFREMDLVKRLKSTPESGTNLEPIIDFFRNEKFRIDLKEHMTIPELKAYIDKGIPVLMLIQAWADNESELSGWSNGHFVVCIGYTSDAILFSDPSLYTPGFIPEKKLMERWHDFDAGERKCYQLGLAVYGKSPDFDLEKIEEIK
jgi:hypothetical protein